MSLLERKLIRDVDRRRWQFVAILATVVLGVALFGASYDAYQNLLASYQALFDRTRFAALTIEGGDRTSVAAAVEGVAGVAAVATRSSADVPARVDRSSLIVRAVGLPSDHRAAVDDVLILRGAYLDASDARGVLVERHMADHFGLAPGDTIEVAGTAGWLPLRVRGIAASAEYIWPARSRQEVLTLPEDFGVIFAAQGLVDDLPGTVQQVLVTYRGAADNPPLTERLIARARGAGAVDAYTQADQPSNAALQEDINGFGELSVLFPVLFLSTAALATYVLLSRMVSAQRPQIGLLLAVGFGRRRVFAHYLGFGIATGLVGAFVGAVIGLGLAGLITGVYTGVIAIPITVVEVRPLTVILGLGFGVVAGALAALAPALRAARLSPAAAMAGVVASGHGGESFSERLVAPLRRLPARWKMVLRGIGRSPLRSGSTVAGVAIAVTLVLVSWGMLDTVQLLLDRQFNQAQRADALVYLARPADAGELSSLAAVSGVAAAEPMAQLPVTIDHDGRRYTTSLAAFPARTTMHTFLSGTGDSSLPAEGVLVGSALRDRLALTTGDEVTLLFGGLDRSIRTRIGGFVDEPLGTYAYASLGQLSDLIGPEAVADATHLANVRLISGADRSKVFDAIKGMGSVEAVIDGRRLQQAANSLMGLFYAFVGIMLALGAVMAFALLFNLMSANIGERVTELASLRASGMSRRQLGRIITAENVLLTLIGIVPGLFVGYAVASEFMASFSSDLFTFDLDIRPTTFLFTAAGVVLAALISQLPILAALRRIDIARVVRERAM